ncbi:hypothetical protein EhV098 [Emiliania huxleyi virus 86]|uniref:Uncharacterized protein n=1 Tax=Emiliania huxleyi virus 86 (isolate United Kingdom/English Channel/1999) TaxID=654925 RepID=Q4A335_EHV8U|nr:hypothetical protein EhV098 [Emiliania huxleyi virus 86]AEO97665.1 hypothetical protein ENVG_00385 [Emiliania huxleyi virus 84]AEP15037.1 hypothetical protein EOVG_00100 [Emiliania huxleyi virus 88]AHA54672.1 hypothetical protein EhV145_00121 [Emiliania huxleyi virus 145]AHA55706.1 hypothetical protein EhV164_00116 [Emiliania huxleyi virus 164]CAI65521.1 hypothetical protein EhV098 [Emiliania huxleyi virus 86]
MSETPSREELRRRLREKTSSRNRAGPSKSKDGVPSGVGRNVDMASMMMSMGIDDPSLIKELASSNNPKAMLSKLGSMVDQMKKDEDTQEYEKTCAPSHIVPEVSDDEEAPELVVV